MPKGHHSAKFARWRSGPPFCECAGFVLECAGSTPLWIRAATAPDGPGTFQKSQVSSLFHRTRTPHLRHSHLKECSSALPGRSLVGPENPLSTIKNPLFAWVALPPGFVE